MIVVNFYHIKSANGLFYYGLDYIRENISLIRLVIVRPSLKFALLKSVPGIKAVACTLCGYLREVSLSTWRRDLLYTPTSHPLPGVNRQMIVLHDAYPFEMGPKALLKRLLFRISLSMSRCWVGYINRSDAKSFLERNGIAEGRMIFAPNRFPDAGRYVADQRAPSPMARVGLMGTDSAKKNYDLLFCAVQRAGLSASLVFRVYGHETEYFSQICTQFPDLNIVLVKSDDDPIEVFFAEIDVLASAAEHEGFGRPIAAALLSEIPVELLDRPVFREFFSGGARFHLDLDELVKALLDRRPKDRLTPFTAPPDVVAAYTMANETIRRLGSITVE